MLATEGNIQLSLIGEVEQKQKKVLKEFHSQGAPQNSHLKPAKFFFKSILNSPQQINTQDY